MHRFGIPLVAGLLFASPVYAQAEPSNMVPGPAATNPAIIRTPPSVRTGSVPPGYDVPAVNPSYPRRLQDYSNPIVRSAPLVPRQNIRRR